MQMLKIATLVAVGAAAAVTIPVASAKSSGWPVIAAGSVDGRADSDDIYLPGRQNVRAIKLCVSKAPLNLREVRVYFRNGAKQDVAMRQRLAPGSCTLRIDLKGNGRDRDITRIRLRYDRGDRGDRNPMIEVTGH
ncbi:MAG: hypothetical protein ABIO68_01700 [Sphingomicrobium sp.]